MQGIILWAALAGLAWVLLKVGIEEALVLATILSLLGWVIGYLLRRGRHERKGLIEDYGRSLLPIFVVVLLLRSFVVEPFRIPSGSMMPTLLIGDFILVNKFTYGLRLPVTRDKILDNNLPKRGDVVVFKWPVDRKTDYIKRVIGLPGDRVMYRDKTIFINGKPMPKKAIAPYKIPSPSGGRMDPMIEGTEMLGDVEHSVLIAPGVPDYRGQCPYMRGGREIVVEEGHYLVMGDNRDHSSDGRCWGQMPEELLVGKAFFIWFSFDTGLPGWVGWDRIGRSVH